MRHASLESGLGGFDYAAEMIGWENVFHCEINPFCKTVLNYYWPNAESYADIFEFDGLPWRGKIDVLTAGFPCQPFSHAGKRKGSTDDRFIWPENRRIIREIRPGCIVLENVTGLISILEPDSISKVENKAFQLFGEGNKDEKVIKSIESVERRIIGTIIEEIKSEGYILPCLEDGTPIILCVPACAKGAVHRRDRIWIVANNTSIGRAGSDIQRQQPGRTEIIGANKADRITTDLTGIRQRSGKPRGYNGSGQQLEGAEQGCNGIDDFRNATGPTAREFANMSKSEFNATYTFNKGLQRSEQPKAFRQRAGTSRSITERIKNESWIEAATRLCGLDDELAGRLDTTAISKSKWRTESLKAYGNAIYWPVAYEIFKAIEQNDK